MSEGKRARCLKEKQRKGGIAKYHTNKKAKQGGGGLFGSMGALDREGGIFPVGSIWA